MTSTIHYFLQGSVASGAGEKDSGDACGFCGNRRRRKARSRAGLIQPQLMLRWGFSQEDTEKLT